MLEPITTVEQLIARFESSTLDYKTTYDLAKTDVRVDIASDVAAFANAIGGVIVVGLKEVGGRVVKVEGVADVAKLMDEVAAAVLCHCVPVPVTPEEHTIVVTQVDAARILAASGAPAPPTDVALVTFAVRPDSRAPIGVRRYSKGQEPKGFADLYRFPIRLDNATRFIDPTELPMWMNSHERRIAIRLRQVPKKAIVHAFHAMHSLKDGDSASAVFEGVDEAKGIAIFSLAGRMNAHVPLAFISAVWTGPRAEDGLSIKVEGTLFPNAHVVGFVPTKG